MAETTLPQNWGWQLSGPQWSYLQGNTEQVSKGMEWHSALISAVRPTPPSNSSLSNEFVISQPEQERR